MDSAPLNLAHFHERRAEKLMKRHQYDEANKAIENSLFYVADAKKTVRTTKALEVLDIIKWDYERKLQQIAMRKQQYERMKQKEILPPVCQSEIIKPPEIINAPSIAARSIDKTIKEFNEKYGSASLMLNMQGLSLAQSNENNNPNCGADDSKASLKSEEKDDIAKRRMSILEEHMLQTDEELPSLAPLELPSFDYTVFMSSGLVENFQK
ncbi:nuclear receptor-binding factor 2 [Musca vetustissima]|uniref:nuclear receptor-binding factor 2 n=1 Tax=Musca vetustissima TaxID=27455 RepID=UPI002AB5ECFD|nr:nuclear receptor-binding factor 2 [Musca vetustissima]